MAANIPKQGAKVPGSDQVIDKVAAFAQEDPTETRNQIHVPAPARADAATEHQYALITGRPSALVGR